jgi:hypothetical protein
MQTSDYDRGKAAEVRFASEHLTDVSWATKEQDINEHWDVQGRRNNGNLYKYDVKAIRKINRSDSDFTDDMTWVEGTNVRGGRGWVKGDADYIAFERKHEWLLIPRDILYDWVLSMLNGTKGKGLYSVYSRLNRPDKITLIKYEDIPEFYLTRLPKKLKDQ